MIRSMTGYGTGSCQTEDTTVDVEVRTVNHRFLDLHIRLPRDYSSLESEIQQLARSLLTRGRVDIAISIQTTRRGEFQVDINTARSYLQAAAKLRNEFHLQDTLDLKTLLGLPGVLQAGEPVIQGAVANATIAAVVLQGVRQALDGVVRMRNQEGEALKAELLRHLDDIGERAKVVRALSPTVALEHRQRLEERLAQILPQNGLDPQRLAQEVALLAEKYDISEELARLEAHLDQFAGWMNLGHDVGKKMDFLLQEMHREINTILSKTGTLEITRAGISIKADIEKLREQVQNVE